MPKYLWDTSNHDWPRGPMNLALAHQQGISGFTAKSSEGSTYVDPNFADAMNRARPVGFPVLGPYHVQWPNNVDQQADFWFATVNRIAPWWRDHPCWFWQIDAELFQNFVPYRQPTINEINLMGDAIVALSGCKPSQVVVYAPQWLYSDTVSGLRYRLLWASSYVPGSGSFTSLYPGDSSDRWHAYGGIVPTLLQYTSTATIAGQSPCDANAARVNSDAELQALFLGGDPGMTQADIDAINAYTLQIAKLQYQALTGAENASFNGGVNVKDAQDFLAGRLGYLQGWMGGQDNSVYNGGTTPKDVQDSLTNQMVSDQAALLFQFGQMPTADEIADAVVAKMGSGAGGQLTKADVLDAVQQVITGTFLTPPPPSAPAP